MHLGDVVCKRQKLGNMASEHSQCSQLTRHPGNNGAPTGKNGCFQGQGLAQQRNRPRAEGAWTALCVLECRLQSWSCLDWNPNSIIYS